MDWKDLLQQLFTALHQQQFDQALRLRCGRCMTPIKRVLEVGKLSCPQCYDAFSPVLKRIVGQMNFKHVGKRPKSGEIQNLEQQMAIAALEGRFDDAQRLRETITRLRST